MPTSRLEEDAATNNIHNQTLNLKHMTRPYDCCHGRGFPAGTGSTPNGRVPELPGTNIRPLCHSLQQDTVCWFVGGENCKNVVGNSLSHVEGSRTIDLTPAMGTYICGNAAQHHTQADLLELKETLSRKKWAYGGIKQVNIVYGKGADAHRSR